MKHSSSDTVLVILGPTAVGKTDIAIDLAQQLHTSIISADSRQCYREMNIGTAKPSEKELHLVKHYFINSHSVRNEVNVGEFERIALQAAAEIFRERRCAILCGGTGLYLKAFCEGIDSMPEIPDHIRNAVREHYKKLGLTWLQQELERKDPDFFSSTQERENPQRMMRALEVVEATGRSVLLFRTGKKQERPFSLLKIGLSLPRDLLRERIDQRVDAMMAAGLVEEVGALLPYRHLNALQTVGYKEIFAYLDGHLSLEDATEAIKTNTHRYAKRQMTWFRKDKDIHWFDAGEKEQVLSFIRKTLPSDAFTS